MKTTAKYAIMLVLSLLGMGVFLLLTGEQEGTLWYKITTKAALLIAFAAILTAAKVLYSHDYLPDMEDK